MLVSEMEQLLRNLDARVGRIEQILPTLATKTDLARFATKTDLERFATKTDLERFATKTDLEDVTRHMRVLYEHLDAKIDTLAEHLSDQMQKMASVLERLDRRP